MWKINNAFQVKNKKTGVQQVAPPPDDEEKIVLVDSDPSEEISPSEYSSLSDDQKEEMQPNGSVLLEDGMDYDMDDASSLAASSLRSSSRYGGRDQHDPFKKKSSLAGSSIYSLSNSKAQSQHGSQDTIYSEEEAQNGYREQFDKTAGLQGIGGAGHFGKVNLKIQYEVKRALLHITVASTSELPGKEQNGPQAYQVRVCLLPKKAGCRWRSSMANGPDPKFDSKCLFNDITPDEIADSALRIRLYGCERRRRDRLLGETILAMISLNLRAANNYNISLEARSLSKALRMQLENKKREQVEVVSEGEAENNESGFDQSSSIGHGAKQQQPEQPAITMALTRAQKVAAEGKITWSELMVSMNYNAITGRLTVELGQASRLHIPNTSKPPDSFVKIVIKAKNQQVLHKSKSSLRKADANPVFKDRFMFQVAMFQLKDITLMFYVCHKKTIGGNEVIGWFALGTNNTGLEERDHWEDMLTAKGDTITRWHVLHEDKH